MTPHTPKKGKGKRARDSEDDEYTDETSPSKSKRSTKAKTSPSKSSGGTRSPGTMKAGEWRDSLPPAWDSEAHRAFRHPDGVITYAKSEIQKFFHLTPREISTLPFETRRNPNPQYAGPTYRYAEQDLAELSKRKSEKLGKPLAPVVKLLEERKARAGRANGAGEDSPGGSVRIMSFSKAEAEIVLLNQPKWLQDTIKAKDEPIRIVHEYTAPTDADIPDPPNIAWEGTGVVGPYRSKDACLMFCLEPDDIADLTTETQWLDPKTVAMRALQKHGGFYAHANLVLKKIRDEIRLLKSQGKTKSDHKFSTTITSQFKPDRNSQYDEGDVGDPLHFSHEVWNKKPEDWEVKRVLTYRPPGMVDMSYHDYSADLYWHPALDN